MGQKESKDENPLKGIVGLQVARVLPHSPAHAAGLLPFFDIITEVDQTVLMDAENATEQFKSYVMERESQQLCFKVYNLRIRAYRDVFCVPSRSWGGGGMLGCSIEWCRADQCVERSWHIVDIVPGGPVGRCPEIQAERDYIIGMQRAEEPVVTLIRDEDDFYARVDMWRSLQRVALQRLQRRSRVVPASSNAGTTGLEMIGKLIFLIYDAVANEIKEVAVDLGPDVDAPLGMNLATGLLHSLLVSPPSAEGGADDDGGGRSESGNSGLPVLTAFVAASGTIGKAEQGMPMPMPMPVPPPPPPASAVNGTSACEEVPSVKYRSPPPPPLSFSPTAPVPPVMHSLPLPPGVPFAPSAAPPSMPPGGVGGAAAVQVAEFNGAAAYAAPPPLFGGRPTIPVISRSRPTASVGRPGALQQVPTEPQGVVPNVPLPMLQQQPRRQQQSAEVVSSGGVVNNGPGAHAAVVASPAVAAPPQPPLAFPKLPPPLQFPIIRPSAPSR